MASRQLGRGAPRQLKKGPRPKIELLPRRLNLFLGDTVEVVDGRYDLGKQGKVIKIDREKQQIFVKGVREVRANLIFRALTVAAWRGGIGEDGRLGKDSRLSESRTLPPPRCR